MAINVPDQPGFMQFGQDFELDVRAYELRSNGIRLKLERIPMELLLFLIERHGQLVTREQIVEKIWGKEIFFDSDNSINAAINKIRRVLRDNSGQPQFVETVTGKGYRFIAPISTPEQKCVPPAVPHHEIRSVAVLPLENLSHDSAQDYFAEGMTEALITTLAKIRALRVISRTSAMQYRHASRSLPEIARQLNVEAIIEGSVLHSGERVRINAQLLDARTDQHLWAESYERDCRDVLSLQGEIAQQIAEEVRVVLTPGERERLRSTRKVDPRAHELYLKARYHWNKRSEENVRKAISYFERALECDPGYAQAHAGLADCYNILAYYNALPPLDAYPKAKAAALKALELDPFLAEPHASIGVIKRDFEWDWSGAEREFQRAIDLNPGYVEALHWRATLLLMLGRTSDGIREKCNALTIDPLSVVIRTDLGRMLYFARDYDHAIREYQSALDLEPNFGSAHLWLANAYEQKGMFQQALSELRIAASLYQGSSYALARLGHCLAMAGQHDDSRSLLDQLKLMSKQKYVSAYDIALIHVGLREFDEALLWLRTALDERSLWLGYMNIEPQLDPLRSDTRFRELVRKVGLEAGD